MASTFGLYVRQRRLSMGWSLREFTRRAGLDPSNHSKLERGAIPAPAGEPLQRLAQALGIKEGSQEWQEFHDLAAASRAVVPPDLDKREVMARLPVFFRVMRTRGTLTRKTLDDLIEKIKEAG